MKEHDEFMKENEDAPSRRWSTPSCAARRAGTEHYEIAAYTGLVATARALGKRDAPTLLRQNLEQETAMLEKATL